MPALLYCRAQLTSIKPPSPDYPKQINSLGDHLRKRRLDRGWLLKQAAKSIGVHPTTLANWEGQRTIPALSAMPGIIEFLGYDPLPPAETLAGRLQHYRLLRGISQKALARQIGVDPCTLARWERGERMPTGLYRKIVDGLLGRES